MKSETKINRIVFCVALLTLAGCQTFKMPSLDSLDIVKSPEFEEAAANIPETYPRAVDAPLEPEDIRSSKQWDKDARSLQQMQSEAIGSGLATTQSSGESEETYESLKRKAQAYKLDDPARDAGANYPPESLLNRKK